MTCYSLSKKRVGKRWNFEKNVYLDPKTQSFYFWGKLSWGSVFTFQVPSRYWTYGTWSKKTPKVCDQNSDFQTFRLQITQNLVEDSFLYILNNSEDKRTLFGEARKKIPRWCSTSSWNFLGDFFGTSDVPKKSIIDLSSPIKMASIIRSAWKFSSMLRLNRAIKIAKKLDDRIRSLFTFPIFSDNRS